MRQVLSCLLVAIALAAIATAAPTADRVESLPLLNETLPSKHYSGYLKALGGSYLHYYAVEAVEKSPADAPVVLWMNGGPGCSSMDGWGYELGPFHFKNFNTSGPVLKLNPHTWSRVANLVFLEAPPGVGFSYREDGNYTISDSENARNNYAAVLDLFSSKFPEWKNNSFFVAGESYGGIYVPTLANQLFKHGGVKNFRGMLVGNGVTSDQYDDFFHGDLAFDHGHGLCSDEVFDACHKYCVHGPDRNMKKCQEECEDPYFAQTGALNFYGAYYKCFEQPKLSWKHIPSIRRKLQWQARKQHTTVEELLHKEYAAAMLASKNGSSAPPSPPGANVPCIDSSEMTTYLNREDVKKALHVKTNLDWAICYEINYVEDVPTVVPIWKELIAARYAVLFYSGNVDRAVPYTGTKAWIASGNWTKTSNTTAWSFNDPSYTYGTQFVGLSEIYENVFTFMRINGAGHMVPQFRPAAAFWMFDNYMKAVNDGISTEETAKMGLDSIRHGH